MPSKCGDCGAAWETFVIDERQGDEICRQCGLVQSASLLSEGPDWSAMDISPPSPPTHPTLPFLRPPPPTKEESIASLLEEATERYPPGVKHVSHQLYNAYKHSVFRDSIKRQVATACVYVACAQNHVRASVHQVAAALGGSVNIRKTMKLVQAISCDAAAALPPTPAVIRTACAKAHLTPRETSDVVRICTTMPATVCQGRSTMSKIAGAMHAASTRKKKQIAEACGVSIPTVTNSYEAMCGYLNCDCEEMRWIYSMPELSRREMSSDPPLRG